MGCCLVKEEPLALELGYENGMDEHSVSKETIEPENKNPNILTHQLLETKAVEIAGISDIVTAIRCIDTSVKIDSSEVPSLYPFVPVPSTMRSLAFAYLCMKSGENLKNIKHFVRNQCKKLIDLMREDNQDIKIYILILIVRCLYTSSKSLKTILLEHGAMKAFIELYKESHRQLRLLAVEASGLLMKGFQEGMHKFVENQGDKEIVELLKQEENDNDALLVLFEVLFDFLYVTLIQDIDGHFIPEHLRVLLDTKLVEYISRLEIRGVSFK